MTPDPATHFQPPTAQQLEDHLLAHPPSPPTPWQQRIPWIVAMVLILLSFAVTGPISGLLPWIAIAWLLGHSSIRTRRALSLQARVKRTQEIAMLRRYTQALRLGWDLLPQAAISPQLHGHTVAMIAHSLDTLGHYDAAIVGYDYLLSRLPSDQPIAVHIGVSRAAAALGAERLSDADDSIRRLRGAVEPYAHTPISAAYRLVQLTQQVRTHHFDQGVEESQGLVDDLRPLGVEAGYGHALLALCHYHHPQNDNDTQDHQQAARTWWQQATLLLPPDTLIKRFPELAPLTELT